VFSWSGYKSEKPCFLSGAGLGKFALAIFARAAQQKATGPLR
jgi:hypothetical protein